MWYLSVILPFLLSTVAIKVPVESNVKAATEIILVNNANPTVDPTYYEADGSSVDSYLVPPDSHKPEDVLPDDIEAPASILLPPSPDKQVDFFYVPSEKSLQTDWYPIAQVESLLPQSDNIPIYISGPSAPADTAENFRNGKNLQDRIVIPVPSRELEPPRENAADDFLIPIPSGELELPAEVIDKQFRVPTNYRVPQRYSGLLATKIKLPTNFQLPVEPTLSLELTPPKPEQGKYKNPTKLYPKKYVGGFRPIPIPISQFAEDSLEVPTAKPVKLFTPSSSSETEYLTPADEKKIYNYQQLEQKRKLKENDEIIAPTVQSYGVSTEASGYSGPNEEYADSNSYPAPLQQEPAQSDSTVAPPPGDRTEFRMHGMKGPHSYQFGYDTGKGKNRQFRYEERDNDGHVRGHYGYMDKHGKLRVVNYDAHPELGFHAEAPVVKD